MNSRHAGEDTKTKSPRREERSSWLPVLLNRIHSTIRNVYTTRALSAPITSPCETIGLGRGCA
jgi:hypothetical protein